MALLSAPVKLRTVGNWSFTELSNNQNKSMNKVLQNKREEIPMQYMWP